MRDENPDAIEPIHDRQLPHGARSRAAGPREARKLIAAQNFSSSGLDLSPAVKTFPSSCAQSPKLV